MKHQLSYSIRPKDPGDEKKNNKNEKISIPSFDPEEFKRYPHKETPRESKKILKKLAIIGGGVTVGLIFGYALLQTFVNQPDLKPGGQDAQPAMSSVVTGNVKEKGISLSEINVFLVQAGVFSSGESANKKASEFKNKQQPAEVVLEDGKYIVYVGIASSRDDALSIAQFYRSDNIPVMIKEKQIPASSLSLKVPSSASEDTLSQLNNMSNTEGELFKLLTANAGNAFSQTKNLSPANEKLTALHESLLKQENALSNFLNDQAKTPFKNSLNELIGGVNAAKNNQLLQLQGNLLRFYSKEKEFRSGKFS